MPETARTGSMPAASDVFADFSALHRPDRPNTWLVAPAAFPGPAPDETAPVFAVDAPALAEAWIAVVKSQPRTTLLVVSADGLQVEAEQRSAVFGFVDRISFRSIPLAPQQSTLVVYSRSQTGYWDFGVNRGRLHEWLTELGQAVPASE